MPTFDIQDVSHAFGERLVLNGVTTTLTEKRIAIIGPNGGGKSTFARLLNGLVSPTHGRVLLNGQDIADKATKVRTAVGFVFPDADNQIIMPTVREDLAFSLRRSGLSSADINRSVDSALAQIGLDNHADASPYTLSGGQKQMLALSAVLIAHPATVVADEPTTLLDLRNAAAIRRRLMGLEQQLITVTHDMDLARRADRVIRIENGRIADDGPAATVIDTYIADMLHTPATDQ